MTAKGEDDSKSANKENEGTMDPGAASIFIDDNLIPSSFLTCRQRIEAMVFLQVIKGLRGNRTSGIQERSEDADTTGGEGADCVDHQTAQGVATPYRDGI